MTFNPWTKKVPIINMGIRNRPVPFVIKANPPAKPEINQYRSLSTPRTMKDQLISTIRISVVSTATWEDLSKNEPLIDNKKAAKNGTIPSKKFLEIKNKQMMTINPIDNVINWAFVKKDKSLEAKVDKISK